ncbi:UNVERIFIED_CONTAM: tRNA pseudouridine synthase 1 [Sesamum radiatum]|uniref:tRNA pseudouridine synthase 1 n=1 Tax=Sesamum radiatum TaxID=300843 RepID=A0AAW2M4C5_SESRA
MAEENPSSLPQEEEPNSKRQKMSTTTTSDDEENPENNTSLPRKPRYKRRKIAIFFAYCGVGYQGMQKNPGAKTIEGDLEEALYFSGAVPEADRGLPRRFDWARSARTDKGVSAVGQVVSGRFYVDPPGFVERLNSYLSPQIRIFGFKRVTASFNAKKFCDRRRYVYLIPVFALDPSCHRDRESVLASLGSGKELAKCLECSERGRKVFGVMGKRSAESKTVAEAVEVGSGISSNSALGEEKIAANSAQNNETGNNDSENNSKIDAGKTGAAKNEKTEDSAVSVDPAILSNNEIGLVEKKIVVTSSGNSNDDADGVNASSETGNTQETRPEDIEKMKECEKNANGHEN